ncbi:MAG: STAS domain-containing protein [Steroidobacteraceae bacterium]
MKKRAHTVRAKSARRAGAAPRAKPRNDALALPAECTLAGADDLKLKLAGLLKNMNGVTIDVSGVRRIDTASLQLLAAFARDRRASELPVVVSGESAAFGEGVRLLGLMRLFA